jgi:hypothetical protein
MSNSRAGPLRSRTAVTGPPLSSVLAPNTAPIASGGGPKTGSDLVEVSGFEPPASSLRTKRSSQLSYTPKGGETLPPWSPAEVTESPNFR